MKPKVEQDQQTGLWWVLGTERHHGLVVTVARAYRRWGDALAHGNRMAARNRREAA